MKATATTPTTAAPTTAPTTTAPTTATAMATPTLSGDIEEIHREACAAHDRFYIDPHNQLLVFTAHHLAKRPCCGCGCRHCPYKPRSYKAPSASMLHSSLDELPDEVDVLFWSGGKDSFLAFRRLRSAAARAILLLTTYDAETAQVAHQNVPIDAVVCQAHALDTPLLGVPVGGVLDYIAALRAALDRLRDNGVTIARIAFGDLHLAHVRNWRESELASLGAQLYYPIWGVSYAVLVKEIEQANVDVTISAVDDNAHVAGIRIGDRFDHRFVERLPPSIDKFGENGEFHTLVRVRR